jgi:hypothetical protein
MADYDKIYPQSGGVGIDRPHTIDAPTQAQPWGTDNFEVDNVNQRGRTPASPDIGDLQRRYDFGNTYTKLSFQRDPFQHLLLAGKKKKFVSDSKFEYAIKRATNTYKRYAYVAGMDVDDAAAQADTTVVSDEAAWGDAAYDHLLTTGLSSAFDDPQLSTGANSTFSVLMMGDYKISGNLSNKVDTTGAKTFTLGESLTKPNWFLPNQIIRIPVGTSAKVVKDYVMARIISTSDLIVNNNATPAVQIAQGTFLFCKVIKAVTTVANQYVTSLNSTSLLLDVSHGVGANSIAEKLEPKRTYIAGSAYHELSGYGETWKAQPFSTDYGYTQIFKNTAMMSGRAMATALKFGENPWKNEWAEKMAEINWDIAQAGYFGEQFIDDDGITYTEGLVNFVLNNGSIFDLTTSTKTVDSFMDDLSALNDPRFAIAQKTSPVYYCGTEVWNWMAKLGGFMKNNAEISPNYSMQFSGRGKMAGVSYRQFDVDGSSIRVVRDIHLDGTNVKMIAANMQACHTVALKANGINRDMAVYPGVKTIKNSGEDYRVDLIQADVGFEFTAPETHAVWL